MCPDPGTGAGMGHSERGCVQLRDATGAFPEFVCDTGMLHREFRSLKRKERSEAV